MVQCFLDLFLIHLHMSYYSIYQFVMDNRSVFDIVYTFLTNT